MKVTILRYDYDGSDGHYIQLFRDGVAVYGGHDQDNGRAQYAKLLGALGIEVEEVDLDDPALPSSPLTSDFDPEYYGFDSYDDDGVTYTGVNKH
jgi:hypothetical protein